MVEQAAKTARNVRLFARVLAIRDGQSSGLWLPVIRHLARRLMPEALVLLADWECRGKPSAAALRYRQAWRLGDALGAYNRAIEHFNRRDLANYRRWLRRAASASDADAARQARHFELRLPHGDARMIGRQRRLRRAELR